MEEFADDNFIFHENGRKLPKQEENTVGKGEIAPFPTVFSKGLFPRGVKRCHCVGLMTLKKDPIENNMGKQGSTFNQHFLLLFL